MNAYPNCGADIEATGDFCHMCGEELGEEPPGDDGNGADDGGEQVGDGDPTGEADRADAAPSPSIPAALVRKARHDSVTVERLTELKPSLTTRYLHDVPLIEYLEPGEQPHFVFAARENSPSVSGSAAMEAPEKGGTGMVMHLVTDEEFAEKSSRCSTRFKAASGRRLVPRDPYGRKRSATSNVSPHSPHSYSVPSSVLTAAPQFGHTEPSIIVL